MPNRFGDEPEAATGTVNRFGDALADAPKTADKPNAPEMGFGRRMLETGIGMAKGLGHTAIGLSDVGRTISGGDFFDRFRPERAKKEEAEGRQRVESFLKPSNASQEAGYGAEQIGEFFVPVLPEVKAGATAGRLGKALVAAGRTGVDVGLKTSAQTGSLQEGAKSGAIAAPVGAAFEALAPNFAGVLKKWALSQYGKVLHPLGNKAKEVAEEHMLDIVSRGYRSAAALTKEGLADKLTARSDQLGKQLENEYARLDPIVKTKLAPIYNDLSDWIDRNAFTKAGTIKDEAVFNAGLEKMKYIQDSLGPYLGDASPSTVQEVRKALDKYVYSNGLTADQSAQAGAWVRKATADAIRGQLNSQHATVAALNNEYHLFRSVAELMQRNVRSDIGKLHFARNTGFAARFLMGAALGGGEAHREGSDVWGTASAAALGGLAMQSTAWRTVSAISKSKIADLIVSGNGEAAANLAARLTGITTRPSQ